MRGVLDRRPARRHAQPPPPVNAAQCAWIEHRDRIGVIVDAYLRTRPPAEMRMLIVELEAVLSAGDHEVGLL
jgi:hypothetical protein